MLTYYVWVIPGYLAEASASSIGVLIDWPGPESTYARYRCDQPVRKGWDQLAKYQSGLNWATYVARCGRLGRGKQVSTANGITGKPAYLKLVFFEQSLVQRGGYLIKSVKTHDQTRSIPSTYLRRSSLFCLLRPVGGH